MRAEGRDILVLAAGEPDFDTPINIREAAVKAMEEGQTRYVPGKGTPALQKAIINKFQQDNNINYYVVEPQKRKIIKKSYTDNFLKNN